MLVWRRGALSAVRLLVLVGIMLLVASDTGWAKMPYFNVTISPSESVAGQPILVTLRVWQDPAHTIRAPAEAKSLDRLLVLRRHDVGASDIPLPLRYRADQDAYTGSVVVPSTGEWLLVAFPDRTGWSSPQVPTGYPDTIPLTIRRQTSVGVTPITSVTEASWVRFPHGPPNVVAGPKIFVGRPGEGQFLSFPQLGFQFQVLKERCKPNLLGRP